jgi:PiT family inorganic phosphate transporter
MLTLVLVVIFTALVFEFINGFHDTANSIATVVATKVLTPGHGGDAGGRHEPARRADRHRGGADHLLGLLDSDVVKATPQVILCAARRHRVEPDHLVEGLPSSSSHALIGGLCGAAWRRPMATGTRWSGRRTSALDQNKGLLWKVFVPMITSPIAGFILGVLVMMALWAIIGDGQRRRPAGADGAAALGQRVLRQGADLLGRVHGLRARPQRCAEDHGHHRDDADRRRAGRHLRRPAGLAGLPAPQNHHGQTIAMWIVLACAVVMAMGTALGGWRIIKTLGHKMVKLHPIHGFAAEVSSASILTLAAHFGMPVSTTHSISTAIMGVGFAKNPKALRIGVIERIVWAWILTIPAAGLIGYLVLRLFQLFGWH